MLSKQYILCKFASSRPHTQFFRAMTGRPLKGAEAYEKWSIIKTVINMTNI